MTEVRLRPIDFYTDAELAAVVGDGCPDFSAMTDAQLEAIAVGIFQLEDV